MIRVRRWGTQSHLDPDYQPASIQDLWSEEWDFPYYSQGGGEPVPHNPTLPYLVELPNNQSYGLYYNSHGELASVVTPAGGKLQYLWEGGVTPSVSTIRRNGSQLIVRRVRKRTVRPDGYTPEGYEEFTKQESQIESEWRTVAAV
jgi:YD repeat-containing protein